VLLHGSAIRPVPSFARVELRVLEELEEELGRDGPEARAELDRAFARFEQTQPHLAAHIGAVLAGPLEEPALALGYFLSIVVWLAFERSFGARLHGVDPEALEAIVASALVDEELHATRSREPFQAGSLIDGAQPGVSSFVREHVGVALATAGVDAGSVHRVDRAVVELTLALSHAVAAPSHSGLSQGPAKTH
jgi:hypothetical protein